MKEEIRVLLPKLGESIHSATIVRWFKRVGDHVRLDEPLLEVSTDKVNSEIPSPASGILLEIHAKNEEELQVGALLALIGSEKEGVPASSAPSKVEQTQDSSSDFFSPALMCLIREHGLTQEEIKQIPGTGMGGRLTKNDLEEYLAKRGAFSLSPDVERLKMTGMRKAIAENMVRSFYEAPHASLVAEVDVTSALKWIQEHKEAFSAKYGCKVTITTFVAQALIRALQQFPLINSSLDGDTILVKHFVNLGIAVSVNQGLLVPVIKQAQSKELPALAQAIHSLSVKARSGQLLPDEVTEGTITLTNFGMTGVQIGIPIIRYPEVAILGVGAIVKRVVPQEGDALAIRSMMHLSLTFDHRVLDGMYGCEFLSALKGYLEVEPTLIL